MLFKLQKNTLIPSQIIGYAFSLFIGVCILVITTQLYFDINPLLHKQTDIFKIKSVVISKEISIFKSIDKEKIYFTEQEIEELESQDFLNDISKFNSATFKVNAYSDEIADMPVFYTDLFFESIPDKYLDVNLEEWKWDSTSNFLPIIVPENYLNLYNFGFAESQGLPVFSKNTISQIQFKLNISGNRQTKKYESRIVGFSNKINTILVPQDFLLWANKRFGTKKNKTSRILIELKNSYNESLLGFFNEKNYSINKDKLESGKLTFFFKSGILFILFVAVIIIILAMSFILLSFNLIIQKNKELILNLYHIGYNQFRIASFYQIIISSISLISFFSAIFVSNLIRSTYLKSLTQLFDYTPESNKIYVIGITICFLSLILYNLILLRNIKIIVALGKKN